MTIPFGEYAKWNPVLTIIEILLKVALNTITLTPHLYNLLFPCSVLYNLVERFAVNINDNVQTNGRRTTGDTKSSQFTFG